ncbi:1-phosphofructokinase [Gorillibacterium sp. sgz5001074]|uniref:1-phosphofructokinase n=1 Tax=Gorillibacterium sp. sgz5001074 TaxID=3446695 RepID=UPI003F6644F6
MKPNVITVTMNPSLDKTVTVPHAALGRLNRIQDVRTDAGGKGINVAKVLKSFGVPVAAWAIAGGYQGRVIEEKLRAADIPTEFMEAPGESRTNLKVVDAETLVTTEFNEPGIRVDADLLQRFTARFVEGLDGVSYAVLGGSLPPGAPPDYYRILIEAARTRGVQVLLDADGEAFQRGIAAAPYAVKPNLHELESYLGEKLESEEEVAAAAKLLIAKGVKLVQISMGAEGSILADESAAYRARPFPITPGSTVGAGDSMVAAMVHGLLQRLPLDGIARLCSAAGTVTASKPGTEVCTLEEVAGKLELVGLSRL